MPGNGERQLHHGSHRNLLDSAAGTPLTPEKIDAIFVPTFRSPAYLTKAARLSVALACPLVTLHSGKWTSAAEAVRRLPPDVDLIAIDVPDRALLRTAWAGHPYGHDVSGTRVSVGRFTREDTVRFHAEHFGPRPAQLFVVGAVDPDVVAAFELAWHDEQDDRFDPAATPHPAR